ncbi:MAG: TonB-dependent receptor plug domain-containing protein, partial [Maribacter sp.]
MKKTINWLFMVFLLGISWTHAQEKSVSGTVTDHDNIPLPGVNIVVEESTVGTQTDFDGNFTIQASEGQALLFSYIGQKGVRLVIGASNTINVKMEQDSEALEEVVVTAFGIKKEKRSVGYAVQEVDGKAITNSGASNVVDALAGKSSGVQVTRSSGSAGGGSRIVIRGATSMVGNNQALIIIDGVRSNNETINAQGGGTNTGSSTAGTAQSNRLMDLNADDIENLSVLKGAAATAIYGTAGSGGVILITTKKGTQGQKMQVNISSQ